MLDIRLDSEYLAIESAAYRPSLVGCAELKNKIASDAEARDHFVSILRSLGHDYVFRRLAGLESTGPDHNADLAREDALEDWFSRFEPGYDWLRLGIWYSDKTDSRLSTACIVDEILFASSSSSTLSTLLLWTPENDYRGMSG